MSENQVMPVFTGQPVKDEEESLNLYRLEESQYELGINDSNELVIGFKLVRVYAKGYDPLEDTLDAIGSDALQSIELPDSLIPGKLYEPRVTNPKRDWETCAIDDFDIMLCEHPGPVPEHSADCLCNDCTAGIGDGP